MAEAGRAVAREKVAGLVRKTRLQPPLRGSLGYIQFSPDGKYLLTQDESSIFVLRREPLASLFRVDALDAKWGIFSADSRSLIFYDDELRVEKWDVETHQREWVRHVTTTGRCLGTALAVLGKFQAISAAGDKMLVENARGDCELYDTSTLKSLAHFTFPARLVHAEFASSGDLLVLTSDQTVYALNTSQQQASVQ